MICKDEKRLHGIIELFLRREMLIEDDELAMYMTKAAEAVFDSRRSTPADTKVRSSKQRSIDEIYDRLRNDV